MWDGIEIRINRYEEVDESQNEKREKENTENNERKGKVKNKK